MQALLADRVLKRLLFAAFVSLESFADVSPGAAVPCSRSGAQVDGRS